MADLRNTEDVQAVAQFNLTASRQFPSWLADHSASIAFSTYQAGKLFLIGLTPEGRLSVFERTIERPMAIAARGDEIFVSSLYQVWKFKNVNRGGSYGEYDRLYAPRSSWVTGDLDIHDLQFNKNGELLFVNTLFSCLSVLSSDDSFRPIWRPSFISRLAAEDRCHLNGLAMHDGEPAFVSAIAQSDVADGWRDSRQDGGVVIDVASSEIVAQNLSMPHSPRWWKGRLYLLNAGTGEFGAIDLNSGKFEPITFCPGFLRGLAIVDNYALVTMSLPREKSGFDGLAIQDRLEKARVAPRCGIAVIDLQSGDLAHWLKFDGLVTELFDVAVLAGTVRPAMVGFRSEEIRRIVSIGPEKPLGFD